MVVHDQTSARKAAPSSSNTVAIVSLAIAGEISATARCYSAGLDADGVRDWRTEARCRARSKAEDKVSVVFFALMALAALAAATMPLLASRMLDELQADELAAKRRSAFLEAQKRAGRSQT